MMKYKKEIIIGVITLVVIGLIIIIKHKPAPAPVATDNTPVAPIVTTPTETPKQIIPSVKTSSLTYTEAFMKYRDGRLIQFSNNCQANPSVMAIAKGSTIMLDNRTAISELITMGANKYSLAPYSFKIITLSIPKTSITYTINCKTAKNSGTLIIE